MTIEEFEKYIESLPDEMLGSNIFFVQLEQAYQFINSRYRDRFPTAAIRRQIVSEFDFYLSTDVNVICDERNNPPSIVDLGFVIVTIEWKEFDKFFQVSLAIGNEEQVIDRFGSHIIADSSLIY